MTLVEGKRYTLSELASVLQESAKDYKPNIDGKIIKDDAQNNTKAVKDIMKEVGKINDGGNWEETKRHTNPEVVKDLNKTTLDYDFTVEPSDEYKERVKAQVHGFPSAQNEKDSKIKEENESLYFKGNEDFYKSNAEKNKKQSEEEQDEKAAGLKSREMPKETYKNNTIFTESKKMKRLHFSNTVFLNEEQMTAKIPEDYKVDGNRFIMKDANGTEYLVECRKHPNIDYVYTNVLQRTNDNELNEEMNRMKALAGYTSASYSGATSTKQRIEESAKLSRLMKHTKKLTEDFNAE